LFPCYASPECLEGLIDDWNDEVERSDKRFKRECEFFEVPESEDLVVPSLDVKTNSATT